MKTQLYFNWIDNIEFKTQLTYCVKNAKEKRKESQSLLSKKLAISLTKIKEIEKGTCVDFNAINNYINYFGESLL